MAQDQLIQLQDLQRLADGDAPDLAESVIAFLAQPDPPLEKALPEGALDVQRLRNLLYQAYNNRNAAERRWQIAQAWQRFLTQTDPLPAPRFFLAALLVDLYEHGREAGRAALVEIARAAPLDHGAWGGLKRIYKLAEERHDAELFGVLAYRFDLEEIRGQRGIVSAGTIHYLRTRAWRWLRHLGGAVPELYPQFAVEVLKHYEADIRNFHIHWVANHILRHNSKQYSIGQFHGALPDDLIKHRAFDEAWKRSPDPLMLLLETCRADPPAKFAIQGLRKDFPKVLRDVTPAWLDRVARRPLASVHEFVVDTLQASPELHAAKLRDLGLHETVLSLLHSPSARARVYAVEYARAHAQDLDADRLVDLVASPHAETNGFAAEMLQKRPARALGYPLLGRLLNTRLGAWAQKALDEGFDRNEIPRPFLVDMMFGSDAQRAWAGGYLERKYQPGEIDAGLWKSVLDDPRAKDNAKALTFALTALGKFPPAAIGADWLIDAATRPGFQTVWTWLRKAESLPGLNIEKVKGLVFDPQYRQLGLDLLGNPKLARLKDITLPWLLALARRADPTLNQWASRYLLQNVAPADFAEGGDAAAGIARLFQLALGDKEPEPVRLFAQTYLRCHHPVIGPVQAESRSYQLAPQMPREAYTAERIWPALRDPRADVRRFAIAITHAELRRWGYHTRVYDLADSDVKEVRGIAYYALLQAGAPDADPARTLTPEEIDPARVFAMTESRLRSTRETAMELIARHYARLGGPERLGWLMASADRSVRLMAVRLLWEKHRPRELPKGWQPKGKAALKIEPAAPFPDVQALRDFLRTVLFGLPPGRQMEQRDGDGPKKHVPASIAKAHAIEVVRDLAVEDEAFARLAAPVLQEFSASLAKGEWQACLAALLRIKKAHPTADLGPGASS